MSESFPKAEKLKNRELISELFHHGRRLTEYPMRMFYLPAPMKPGIPAQAAVTVPKKRFRKAVERNRVKRLMRESYRRHKHLIFNNNEGTFAFLFLYLGKELPEQETLDGCMQQLIAKFTEAHENTQP